MYSFLYFLQALFYAGRTPFQYSYNCCNNWTYQSRLPISASQSAGTEGNFAGATLRCQGHPSSTANAATTCPFPEALKSARKQRVVMLLKLTATKPRVGPRGWSADRSMRCQECAQRACGTFGGLSSSTEGLPDVRCVDTVVQRLVALITRRTLRNGFLAA